MGDAFLDPTVAERYIKSRPVFPDSIVTEIVKEFPKQTTGPPIARAVDLGCGSGQLSLLLSAVAGWVTAVDLSSVQIDQARNHRNAENIRYHVGTYDCVPQVDESIDLITCGQSAHFFDDALFHKEVDRILKPGGLLALAGYGLNHLTNLSDDVNRLNRQFWVETLKPYWFEKREIVNNHYRDMKLPYDNSKRFDTYIERSYDIDLFAEYCRSLSAYHKFKQAQPLADDPVDILVTEVLKSIEGKSAYVNVRWPVFLVMSRKLR